MIRRTITAALATALIAGSGFLIACGDDDDGSSGGNPTSPAGGLPANLTKVTVSDDKFTPVSLQIPVGANVTWEWTGNNPHLIVANWDGEQVNSPKLTGTGVFLYAFQKAGTYQYMCGVHGAAMSGTIIVK